MRMRRNAAFCLALWAALTAGSPLVAPAAAHADEPVNVAPGERLAVATEIPQSEAVDTLLVMACAALALLMIPAVGLFYGGMVRRKNVLSAFQQSFVLLGVVPIQWVVVGYSLAFGHDTFAGLCGGWQWFGLQGVGLEPTALAPRVPHQVFMVFEMLVAVVPAVLISGAIAERMKFVSYRAFRHFMDDFGLRPSRTLGMESGWLDQATGCARLRRRAGDSPHFRAGGTCAARWRLGSGKASITRTSTHTTSH